MPYTEIKQRNGKKYFYRVKSMRNKNKFSKKRIYIGKNLSKEELVKKQELADKQFLKEKINKNISIITSKIRSILKKNKIKKAGIFGSYSKGEQNKNSDIDILIEPPKDMGLGFFKINIELEKKLRKKVHLVTYKYINPHIKENILKDEIRII